MSNVRKILIKNAKICDILIFSRHCPELKQIEVQILDWYGRISPLDWDSPRNTLPYLNSERKKLANVHKISIFVPERIFLPIKLTQKINFSLIELKCHRSWMGSNPFFDRDIDRFHQGSKSSGVNPQRVSDELLWGSEVADDCPDKV